MAIDDHMNAGPTVPALFAEITASLEDAHEIAVQGQDSRLDPSVYRVCAFELGRLLDQIRALSERVDLAVR